MTWNLRTDIAPAFDAPLTKMSFISGGLYVVKTKAQRNNIKEAFRKYSLSERTLVAVTDDRKIYALNKIISGNSTTDADWDNFLDIAQSLTPIGEWEADNTDPVLADTDAAQLNGQFYFVTGAPGGVVVDIATLFQGNLITVYDGDWIMSIGDYWAHVRPNTTWASLSRPASIIDYENGIVQSHTQPQSSITDLLTDLSAKFDSSDVGDYTEDYGVVPNTALTDKIFVDTHFIKKNDSYTSTEVDNLLTGLSLLGLADTPSSYAGAGLQLLRVNSGVSAIEFVNGSTVYSTTGHQHVKTDLTDFADTDYFRTGADSTLSTNVTLLGGTNNFSFENIELSIKSDSLLRVYQDDDATDAILINSVAENGQISIWASATQTYKFGGTGVNWIDATAGFGIGTNTPSTTATVHFGGTGGVILPVGTLAQRVATAGLLRLNTDSNAFEGYNGVGWDVLGAGAASTNFIALTDTPAAYTSAAQVVRINATNDGLEFVDASELTSAGTFEGGLTGEILVKNSDVNYDWDWAAHGLFVHEDAANDIVEMLKIQRTTSDTPAIGLGSSIGFYLENTDGVAKKGEIVFSMTDVSTNDAGKFEVFLEAPFSLFNPIIAINTKTNSVYIGNQTNVPTIGNSSIGIGHNADASGQSSIVIGKSAEGITQNCVVIGPNAGNTTGAVGTRHISIGDNANGTANEIIGQDSLTIGLSASGRGLGAVSLGGLCKSAIWSLSLGYNSSANITSLDSYGIAIGNTAVTDAENAQAYGRFMSSTAAGAIMMGHHTSVIVNTVADSFELSFGAVRAFKTGILLGTQVTVNADPDTNLTAVENGVIAYDSTDHQLRGYLNGGWVGIDTDTFKRLDDISDGATPPIDCLDYTFTKSFWSTAESTPALSVSNLGEDLLIAVKKTIAGDSVVTIDGTGLKFIDSGAKALPTTSVDITLSDTVNFFFEISLSDSGTTDGGSRVILVIVK